MFSIGTTEEGFAFFLPDTYSKSNRILGSGIRRSINGTARRDVTARKNIFTLGFEDMSDSQLAQLFTVYQLCIDNSKVLTFKDDEGEYQVIWGGDSFGISERVKGEGINWSGNIILEEV